MSEKITPFMPLGETHPPEGVAYEFKEMPRQEKPREKALRLGLRALTDTELLAILLGSGTTGKSVLALAQEMLRDNHFHLRRLSRMSVAEMTKKYKGVGKVKALLLCAAMAFGERCQADFEDLDPPMLSSENVAEYMGKYLRRQPHEEFWILHLSRSNRVQFEEQLSRGGLSSTSVDPKIIAKSLIDHLSSGVILVHNHPSGNLNPSSQDDILTRRITEVCRLIDVQVFDHVIIAPTGHYSYRDNGRL